MQFLVETIDVLYNHTVLRVVRVLSLFFEQEPVVVLHRPASGTYVPDADEDAHLPQSGESDLTEEHVSETSLGEEQHEVSTFRPVNEVLEERSHADAFLKTVAFVGSAEAPLFVAPTKAFDTVVTTLRYGSSVVVEGAEGRFAHVREGGVVGWMLRDDLFSRGADVYPECVVGKTYPYDDPHTIRLRACINDVFYGGETESSLQAPEYVLYKLFRRHLTIVWPATRPRTPGRWHTILKGTPGIHIGVTPKTGSIIEYTLENDIGHLAYVDAVFSDERISLSEANYPDNGIYSERTLTKEEWQALNPVFITVS